jgi:outer membrane protein assembly factor BamB
MAVPRKEGRGRTTVSRVARHSLVVMATAVALIAAPQVAFASVSRTADAGTAQTNGPVYAMAQVGNLTIIGGRFTAVSGQPRLNVAAIRQDGTLDPTFNPTVEGEVLALAGSEDGSRVFIGGLFSQAGGAARANLAAVDAVTGLAVPSWQADTAGNQPTVHSLAVAGERLYVAGRFSGIDGSRRKRLVALDAVGGDVITQFQPAPSAIVKAVVVSADGTRVYAGGNFTEIGGQTRLHSVAELLASTGEATAFNPTQGGGKVITIALSPDGSRIYSSTENNTLFPYDLSTSQPAWTVKSSGNVQAIAVSQTEVYIGGHFSQLTTFNTKRNLAASLNPATGAVTSWDPQLTGRNKGVWALVLMPDHLLMAGGIVTVEGVKHKGFARFAGTP